MPDNQQNEPEYPKYRYTIPQLLQLSGIACLPFDLSRFTYEAARAGVIPSLDGCAMSSRKSSASCAKAVSAEATGNADVLVFQGNRVTHPGRQPKIPPPVERQKDEGFARFLKKHSSPTHNRVTAGGRIVPMEPRSPPVFALDSNLTHRSQGSPEDQGSQRTQENVFYTREQNLENQQSYDIGEFGPGRAQKNLQSAAVRSMPEQSDTLAPVFFPQQAPSNLMNAQMSAGYASASMLTPIRPFFPEQQMGGPVIPQSMQVPSMTYNPYHSPPVMVATMPPDNDFGTSPTWSTFNQNFMSPGSMDMVSIYQTLVAWEQHYVELDVQLKNIDRHRAMHQLDPYLATQRRVIVQQRSDAKDIVRECQAMLGFRRLMDSSQDSFTTSFNVDAPAYVPTRFFDSTEAMPHKHSSEPVHSTPGTDKPKGNGNCRAIPIVSPPDQRKDEKRHLQEAKHNVSAQDAEDLDEWGVQNRSAPPEIHREQSRLSDMLQAEQQRLSSGRDSASQQPSRSQSSDESQQGMSVNNVSDVLGTEADTTRDTRPQLVPENIPRDNADEMQQVMDAIGRPKGTTTQVRLLDNRVISVEGQGLDLSSIATRPQTGRNGSMRGNTRYLTPSQPQSGHPRKRVTAAIPILSADIPTGKENVLAAPRGHQKAATDAFLAQFNAVEDNVALAVKPETRSLRTASNGLVDDRKYSGKYPSAAEDLTRTVNNLSLNVQQALLPNPALEQDSRSSRTGTSVFADDLLNKGYSLVSVQNVNALGRLPQNLDGTADVRQIAQAHLAAVEKAKSPRLFRRNGTNGGAWYGPYCREVFERARFSSSANRSPKTHAP